MQWMDTVNFYSCNCWLGRPMCLGLCDRWSEWTPSVHSSESPRWHRHSVPVRRHWTVLRQVVGSRRRICPWQQLSAWLVRGTLPCTDASFVLLIPLHSWWLSQLGPWLYGCNSYCSFLHKISQNQQKAVISNFVREKHLVCIPNVLSILSERKIHFLLNYRQNKILFAYI